MLTTAQQRERDEIARQTRDRIEMATTGLQGLTDAEFVDAVMADTQTRRMASFAPKVRELGHMLARHGDQIERENGE